MSEFIDYSQYRSWMQCSWLWFEKYVNQREPKPSTRQYVDNALTFGSLVHGGLEHWGKARSPVVPQALAEELRVSPEAYVLAQEMVHEYVRRYPTEQWKIHVEEMPTLFPIPISGYTGLAKLDAYFHNPELTMVENGIAGEQLALEPGWWIREYKTKDAQKPRDLYAAAWEMNMQADFQLLALWEKTGEIPCGILINVLEKPRMYVPKRKCKGCGELLEMSTYIATGDGHGCMLCGAVQKLSPYTPKTEHRAEFFRLRVTRTAKELETSRRQIAVIAEGMAGMREGPYGDSRFVGLDASIPNKDSCVYFNSKCPYFDNHKYHNSTLTDSNMISRDATRYVGLEQLGVAAPTPTQPMV